MLLLQFLLHGGCIDGVVLPVPSSLLPRPCGSHGPLMLRQRGCAQRYLHRLS